MKLALLSIFLALPLMVGCGAVQSTTPPAALAPGYSSAADQAVGEGLAAVNAFVNQEKVNYAAMTPTQQETEKTTLNTLITATNLANATYAAFHAGTGTLPAAQSAMATAQNDQATLAASKGVGYDALPDASGKCPTGDVLTGGANGVSVCTKAVN